MKKFLSLALVSLLALGAFGSCDPVKDDPNTPEPSEIAVTGVTSTKPLFSS
jgi:hypothetical protein